MNSKLMIFLYFIIQDENSFQLLTTIWNSIENCKETQLVVINTFKKSTSRWLSKKFNIEKFGNLHGCNLKVSCLGFPNKSPVNNLNELTFSEQLHAKILIALAVNLNFTLTFHFDKREDIDINLGHYISLHEIISLPLYNKLSQPFLFRESLIAIPVGEEYDGYEKLLLPFDNDVWFWIVMTFVITFVVIIVLSLLKSQIRNFIIGKDIQAPAMNVLLIFAGASQVRMPVRNFARFLVIVFVLYSLIIRTAWQAKMFEFLQQEIRKPEVQSFEEMFDKNFTFFMDRSYQFYNEFSTITQKRNVIHVIKEDEIVNVYSQKLNNPKFNGAIQVYHDQLKVQAINTKGKFLDRIFKHRLFGEYLTILFEKHAGHMCEKLDEKIQQLFAGGLIDFFEQDYNEYLKKKRYEHLQTSGPEVLTMSDLNAGFTIWVCSVLLAISAFIGELIWFKFVTRK